MLVTVYLYNELQYDKYHKNIQRLYQLATIFIKDGKEDKTPNTPAPMAKEYGWGESALGKRVKFPGDTSGNYLEVVGVVKDFNQKSLYNPIAPLILFYRPNNNSIQLKLDAKNIPSTVTSIEKSWKTAFPDLPFQYTFLDQDFDSQYAADQKRGKIFVAFSALTIIITCLGLLGLVAFTTQQRQKEISIRKVMGANAGQIIPLIIRNFIALIGLS